MCASQFDPDELLSPYSAFVFVLSTYTEGSPTTTATAFYNWLEDTSNDFRVPKSLYSSMLLSYSSSYYFVE
jgi:sulfite reductase alpha subunit-like flavoprotein